MKLLRPRSLTGFAMLLLAASMFGATMSHEEIVVGTTYAKLNYALQVGAMADMASHSYGTPQTFDDATVTQRLSGAGIQVQINDLTTGPISAISDTPLKDLVTLAPKGKPVLAIIGTGLSVDDFGQHSFLHYIVINVQPAQGMNPQAEAFSLGTIIGGDVKNAIVERYARFTMAVTYKGHTEGPYQAMFLFGKSKDGSEKVWAFDDYLANLNAIFAQETQVDALLETNFRDLPFVSRWLRANERLESTCIAGKPCCDAEKMACGVAHGDLSNAFSRPIKATPFSAPPQPQPSTAPSAAPRSAVPLGTILLLPRAGGSPPRSLGEPGA